jgi:hypothetical protein
MLNQRPLPVIVSFGKHLDETAGDVAAAARKVVDLISNRIR